MSRGRLPEGYKGIEKLIKEFRLKNPKGKIQTNPVLLGEGMVLMTATVTDDSGAIGSGMSLADTQEEKSVEKAESGSIRRALLTLGYESLEVEEEDSKEEPLREKPISKSDRDDDENEEKDEKPRSRFGNKKADSNDKRKNSDEESDDESEEQEEGQSRFKRGSRFQRN